MNRMVSAARMYIALFVVVFVVGVAGVAVTEPAALVVFDKLSPVLMLVLGYYFGQGGAARR